MQKVESIKDIKLDTFVFKYGLEFCAPCQMAEDNLTKLEKEFPNVPFYTCLNSDEMMDMGYKIAPVVIVRKNGNQYEQNDTTLLTDEDELKGWLQEVLN